MSLAGERHYDDFGEFKMDFIKANGRLYHSLTRYTRHLRILTPHTRGATGLVQLKTNQLSLGNNRILKSYERFACLAIDLRYLE